jgi:hypothetical protein
LKLRIVETAHAELPRQPTKRRGHRKGGLDQGERPNFGTFRTRSGAGGSYRVEIRTLEAFSHSCEGK